MRKLALPALLGSRPPQARGFEHQGVAYSFVLASGTQILSYLYPSLQILENTNKLFFALLTHLSRYLVASLHKNIKTFNLKRSGRGAWVASVG